MKKVLLLIIIIAAMVIAPACHEHEWKEATCTEPKTCATCNKTEGEPLGHDWVEASCTKPETCSRCNETKGKPLGHKWEDATCTEPKVCSVCGETEGEPLGHNVEEWTVTKESTCTEKGLKTGVCTVCGETVEEELDLIDHIAGEWEVTVEATATTEGTRINKCIMCGKLLHTQTFTLSEDEIKALFIGAAKNIDYDELCRYPDKYKGEKVHFSGYVTQVCSEASSALYYSTYRVNTSGRYDDDVYIKIDNYGSGRRILEDDYIDFYGVFNGIYTYKTVRGNARSIPEIIVNYWD